MNYTNIPIGTSNPGCVIFLVDQSWSMNEDWESGKKTEQAALILSRAIHNLGVKCQHEEEIRKRCFVAIISYGDSVNCITEGMIDEVYEAPIEVKKVNKSIPDGAGGIVVVETELPIWIKPKANGGTPMHEAFDHATTILTDWIANWQDCFPPVVINITDGEPSNPSLTGDSARTLMNMSTSDGNVLLSGLTQF